MRPDPDSHHNRLIREIADLRCPYCSQAPTLIRTSEYPEHADPLRWRAAMGCLDCLISISDFGATKQGAIDAVVNHWHWLYPEPIDVRDALAIRPGRP